MKDYFEIKKTLEPVKSHLDNGLDEQVDYKIKQPALRSTPVPKVKVMPSIKKKAIAPKLERFFMKANLTYSTIYEKTNKHRKTKELHTSSYKRIEHQVVELPVWASSKEDARIKFENEITDDMEERDNYKKFRKVDQFDIVQETPESDYHQQESKKMMMKSADHVIYDFIPSDDKLLKNDGFCVLDVFLGTYAPLIKKLTRDYFINLCY